MAAGTVPGAELFQQTKEDGDAKIRIRKQDLEKRPTYLPLHELEDQVALMSE